jgi:hypothetical protein
LLVRLIPKSPTTVYITPKKKDDAAEDMSRVSLSISATERQSL